MIYETFVFRPNEKKKKEDLLYIAYIGIAILVVVLFYIYIPGVGFRAVLTVSIALIGLKIADDKKKGVRRFGHLIDRLTLSDEFISFGGNKVPIGELSNILIYADDHYGGPGDLLSHSYGIDNKVEFYYKGKHYEFQFQVKSKADMKLVQDIAAKVEK